MVRVPLCVRYYFDWTELTGRVSIWDDETQSYEWS